MDKFNTILNTFQGNSLIRIFIFYTRAIICSYSVLCLRKLTTTRDFENFRNSDYISKCISLKFKLHSLENSQLIQSTSLNGVRGHLVMGYFPGTESCQ